jgi:drug/metabolite transporter (DMT)-like permease
MALWVWLAITAAAAQTVRGAGQRGLKPKLGDYGASFIRFSYAIPFAWAWLLGYGHVAEQPMPHLHAEFLLWVTIAGLMQIIFTVTLVMLFTHRSFAAGTAFSKTEVLQAAIFEALIIGFVVSFQVGAAIVIGVIAVFFLSLAKSSVSLGNLVRSLMTRQTAIGLASGASLGFCTVAYRAATDSLDGADLMMRASVTGGVSVLIQTAMLGGFMWFKARDQLFATFVEWRPSLIVGLSGAVATLCWFYAFSAHAVAPVRAVGQIELLFVLAISFFYFREKPSWQELVAMVLLVISIIMVLLG